MIEWIGIKDYDYIFRLLFPKGFERMGIRDSWFAYGLCASGTTLLCIDGERPVMVVLLHWRSKDIVEIRLCPLLSKWREQIEALVLLKKTIFTKTRIKYAFMFCIQKPHKKLAKAVGAKIDILDFGIIYSWRK